MKLSQLFLTSSFFIGTALADSPLQVPLIVDGSCTITLTGKLKNNNKIISYTIGDNTPMPKLKVFRYVPQNTTAELEFDGVGNRTATHFSGTIHLLSVHNNTYTFLPKGVMKGFDYEATPTSIIITIPDPS